MTPSGNRPGTTPIWRWGRRVLGAVLTVACFAFIGKFLVDNSAGFLELPPRIDPMKATAYLAFYFAYMAFQSYVWTLMFSGYGVRLSLRDACVIYGATNFLAYLPGRVASAIGFGLMARDLQISGTLSVFVFVRAQLLFLAAGCVAVGAALLVAPGELGGHIPSWAGVPIAVTILAILGGLHPRVLRPILRLVERVTRRPIGQWPLTPGQMLRDFALLLASWGIICTAYWLLIGSAAGAAAWPGLFDVAVIFIFSNIVGTLAVFVPAGLGVRELNLVIGIGLLTQPSIAAWAALAHRVVGIVLSFVLYVAGRVLQRARSHDR